MVYPDDGFDPLDRAADGAGRALHRPPRRADHVHRRARPSALQASSISRTLRTGIMAGSPCPIEVMKRVVDQMHMTRDHHRLRHDRDQPGQLPELDRRPARTSASPPSAGAAAPRGQDRRPRDRRASCRAATPGELCTRGYSVMRGYWDDEEKTREAIDADGWMHTGDLATMDAEGYGNIVGRIKDMVIRGGENIYPREIEEFLYRHPKVAGRAGGRRARQEVRRGALRLDHRQAGPGPDAPTKSATSARARSPTTRSRATSASSPSSR